MAGVDNADGTTSALGAAGAVGVRVAASHRQALWLGCALALLSCGLVLLGIAVGSTGFDSVRHMQNDPQALQIITEIRLPRTAGAWLAGALLGLAGAVAQGLFRNPLADPYLLGSASGASLGVALAMMLFGVSPLATSALARIGLTGAAFVGAVAAVLLTLLLASGVQHTLRLLLASSRRSVCCTPLASSSVSSTAATAPTKAAPVSPMRANALVASGDTPNSIIASATPSDAPDALPSR